jgi:putative hydrolase of the HAD superfamily
VFERALLLDAGVEPPELAAVGAVVRAEHRRASLYSHVPPGTRETLARLREAGFLVAAVSNSDGTAATLLERAGLGDALEFVIDSGLVGVEKPDPRIFRIALERAGATPARACYLGDIYAIDVIGARDAGIEPVLLDPLGQYGHLDCATIPQVSALPELVAHLLDR